MWTPLPAHDRDSIALALSDYPRSRVDGMPTPRRAASGARERYVTRKHEPVDQHRRPRPGRRDRVLVDRRRYRRAEHETRRLSSRGAPGRSLSSGRPKAGPGGRGRLGAVAISSSRNREGRDGFAALAMTMRLSRCDRVSCYTAAFGPSVTRRLRPEVAELDGWPARRYLLQKSPGSLGAAGGRSVRPWIVSDRVRGPRLRRDRRSRSSAVMSGDRHRDCGFGQRLWGSMRAGMAR
jgi:hypothetical protein